MLDPDATLVDVQGVRDRYPWIADDRAARRIVRQAGGRIIAGRWAVPLDLLVRWERAWNRPGVAREAVGRDLRAADVSRMGNTHDHGCVPKTLDGDWWQSTP